VFYAFVQKPPVGGFCTKFGAWVGIADPITCDKICLGDRLRGRVDSLCVGVENRISH